MAPIFVSSTGRVFFSASGLYSWGPWLRPGVLSHFHEEVSNGFGVGFPLFYVRVGRGRGVQRDVSICNFQGRGFPEWSPDPRGVANALSSFLGGKNMASLV